VVAAERLLDSAHVPRRGATGLAAALEVLGEHDAVALADSLEPSAGELVAERPVALGQHGIGGVAYERVPENVLGVGLGEATLRAGRDALGVDELVEPFAGAPDARLAPEKRRDPVPPKHLPEDAGGAQHAARFGIESLDARLGHGQHRLGQLVALS